MGISVNAKNRLFKGLVLVRRLFLLFAQQEKLFYTDYKEYELLIKNRLAGLPVYEKITEKERYL